MIVIGKVKYFMGEHAKIEVFGYKNESNDLWQFDKINIKSLFEPSGYIFEPSFKQNYPNNIEGDIIEFESELNPKVENDITLDIYKIKYKGIKSNNFNYRIFEFEHLFLNPYFIDLDYLSDQILNHYKHFFYISYQNNYYGPFKKESNNVLPKTGKSVNVYENIEFFKTDNECIVLKVPNNPKESIAAETDKQIHDWFKTLIKESNHPVLKAIKENPNWKDKLVSLVSNNSEFEKHRLELAINDLDTIDLTLTELESLSNISYPVREVMSKKYDLFTEEIKTLLHEEHKTIELEKNEEIAKLNREIESLNKQKKQIISELEYSTNNQNNQLQTHNSKLDQIKIEINKANDTLKYIDENKDKILRDLSIFSSILPNNEIHKPTQRVNKYEIKSTTNHQLEKRDILEKIKLSLNLLGYNAELDDLRETLIGLGSHQCIIADNLELPLAIIKSLNNCTYYYSNVEINWLSFEKLIDSGLIKAFENAISNPTVLHFFILRDINISSPECYARPLLDFNNKLLPELSSGVKLWPNNFKIIGIIQPFPEIGLPIIESTFKNWYGCKRNTISLAKESNIEILDSYFDINLFYSLYSNDIENYLDEYF